MLLHISPKLHIPGDKRHVVQLVDLKVEELDLVLGEQDLTVRRPYPNKHYSVACRRIGQKAVDGIFIESAQFLPIYTVVSRWSVDGTDPITHRVQHVLLDHELDAVTDRASLWHSFPSWNWISRWPSFYAGLPPLEIEPVMAVKRQSLQHRRSLSVVRDDYTKAGVLAYREEKYMVPTIERRRLDGERAVHWRLPTMANAFKV